MRNDFASKPFSALRGKSVGGSKGRVDAIAGRGYRFEVKSLGFALGLSLVLTACASRPKDVLTPVAARCHPPARSRCWWRRRAHARQNPGEMFSGERGTGSSFAEITVSIPPASVRKVGEVAWPKKLPSNPATDFAVVKAEDLTLMVRRGGSAPLSGRARTTASWFSSMVSTIASKTRFIVLPRSPTIRARTACRS